QSSLLAPFTGLLAVRLQPPSRSRSDNLMGQNYYSEINLHITWHTKACAPLLIPKKGARTRVCRGPDPFVVLQTTSYLLHGSLFHFRSSLPRSNRTAR